MLQKYFAFEVETLAFASQFAKLIPEGCLIYLYGPLGAGKTTFARGFLRGLGYTGKVKSPTYTLIEPYEVAGRRIYHGDFYRIKSENELSELDLSEYLSPEAICLIEWPEKGVNVLPEPDLTCFLAASGEGRELKIEAKSEKGALILTNVQNI